jgi:hypothetical protein
MADIQFEEPQYRVKASEKPSWLARLVMSTGLAKDEAGIRKALLGILLIVIIAILAIWFI